MVKVKGVIEQIEATKSYKLSDYEDIFSNSEIVEYIILEETKRQLMQLDEALSDMKFKLKNENEKFNELHELFQSFQQSSAFIEDGIETEAAFYRDLKMLTTWISSYFKVEDEPKFHQFLQVCIMRLLSPS